MITFTAASTTKEVGESVLFQPVFEDLSHVPFMDNYCTCITRTFGTPLEVFQQTTRQNMSVTTIFDPPTCITLTLIITTPGRTHHYQ